MHLARSRFGSSPAGGRRVRVAPRWLALAALLVLAAFGCASDEQKLEAHLARAEELRQADQPREALLELRSALKLDPKNAEINFEIGRLLAGQERWTDALFFYEEALRLDPSHEEAALGVARIRAFDDPERAREVLDALIERRPDSVAARVQSSALALVEQDMDRARREALTATELGPDHAAAWFQLGRVRQAFIQLAQQAQEEQGAPDEALLREGVAAFDRAHTLAKSQDAPALVRSSLIEKARVLAAWPGHHDEARAAFVAALDEAEAAGDPDALANAANAMESFGRLSQHPDARAEALERLVAAQPDRVAAWRMLAGIAASQGGSPQGVYERMLEAAPETAGAHVEYARFLARNEGADAATAHLRKALEEVRDPLAVLGALAEVQLASGETDAAAATVQEMEARDAGDPRTHLAKGSLALQQGRPAEAVEVLRDSVSVHARPDAYRMLAAGLMRTGAMEEALQAVDRAIELYPTFNREAQRLRIDILRRQGDWEGVSRSLLDMARRGMQLTPPEREVLVAALYRTGRREPARKMLDRMLTREDATPGVVLLFARWEGPRDPERARELLEASFAEHPGSMGLLDALVAMELQAARPDRALAHVEKAAEAGQADPRLPLFRARALAGMSQADAALAAAQEAFERMPRSREAMDLLVSLYLATGREDEAIRSFEQAREAGVLEPGGEVVLGRLYLQAGRRAEAIEALEGAVRRGSAPAVARNDLAYLLAEDGTDLDRALSLALEAKEALPNDPAVADTLGYVLLQRGLPGPAEARFREAVRLAEEQQQERPEYHYRLGLALQQLGRPAEAAEAFEAALALDASFASAEDARAALEAARAAAPAS